MMVGGPTCAYRHRDIDSIIDDQWHPRFLRYEEQTPVQNRREYEIDQLFSHITRGTVDEGERRTETPNSHSSDESGGKIEETN
jgi:hypothetical protein